MKGNDRQRQKERIEDRIINRIDREHADEIIRKFNQGPLRIPIIDLICYKSTCLNRPIRSYGV